MGPDCFLLPFPASALGAGAALGMSRISWAPILVTPLSPGCAMYVYIAIVWYLRLEGGMWALSGVGSSITGCWLSSRKVPPSKGIASHLQHFPSARHRVSMQEVPRSLSPGLLVAPLCGHLSGRHWDADGYQDSSVKGVHSEPPQEEGTGSSTALQE